jgi:hypothetical protein
MINSEFRLLGLRVALFAAKVWPERLKLLEDRLKYVATYEPL